MKLIVVQSFLLGCTCIDLHCRAAWFVVYVSVLSVSVLNCSTVDYTY